MKHIASMNTERLGCRVRPVLYPYIASLSTMRFCRKFSRNNMARDSEIKTNRYLMDSKCKWVYKIGQLAWIFYSLCIKNFCNISFEN